MASLPLVSDPAESFAVFAQELNFTRAAERLFISQPALHTKLKKFSSAVGVALYENHGGRLILTEEGRDLAGFIEELLKMRDEFAPMLQRERTEPVTVAAGEGSFLYLLGPALQAMLGSVGPGIRLQTLPAASALAAVRKSEADIGVGVFREVPQQIESDEIALVRQVAAVPLDHRLGRRGSLRLMDLENEPLVMPAQGRPMRDRITRELKEAGVHAQIAIEAHGWELLLSFVAMGAGCAIVNEYVGERPGLRLIPIRDLQEPAVSYKVIKRRRSHPDLSVESVYEGIRRAAQPASHLGVR
jgi:DNA-binding transcriptional LysR family regulator